MDSQFIPPYATGLSAFILLTQTGIRAYHSACNRRAAKASLSHAMEHDQADVGLEDSEGHGLKGLVQRSGGRVVLTYKIARLLSCVALLCLAIATVCNGLLGTDLSDSSPSNLRVFAQSAVYVSHPVVMLASSSR